MEDIQAKDYGRRDTKGLVNPDDGPVDVFGLFRLVQDRLRRRCARYPRHRVHLIGEALSDVGAMDHDDLVRETNSQTGPRPMDPLRPQGVHRFHDMEIPGHTFGRQVSHLGVIVQDVLVFGIWRGRLEGGLMVAHDQFGDLEEVVAVADVGGKRGRKGFHRQIVSTGG